MSQDGLAAFEPAFADELAVIMEWAFDYLQRDGEGDPDDDGAGLTYTVTDVTDHGTLRLSGTALGLNEKTVPWEACLEEANGDAALIESRGGTLAVTTDAHVVKPLFFPGGDIGRLAVCGTVNDLAVAGAR